MKQWVRQDYLVLDGGIGLFDIASKSFPYYAYKTGFLYTRYKQQGNYTDLYYYDSGNNTEIQITENGQLKVPGGGSSDKIISTDNDKQLQISTSGLLTLTDLPSTELARLDFTKNYSIIIGRNAGLNLHSSTSSDVIIGESAYSTSTNAPSSLVAIGYYVSGDSTGTSGRNSVLIGYECARYANNLEDNVFIGYRSGYQFNSIGDTGYRNVFIGREVATYMRNGWSNVFIGYQVGYGDSSYGNIQYNIGIGDSALYSCYGSYNIGLGYRAIYSASSESTYNIAIGHMAMGGTSYQKTNGYSIGIGYQALRDLTSGSSNIAIGGNAMPSNTTGSNNVAIGHNTCVSLGTASDIVAIGHSAGYSITSGNNNILIGKSAGYSITTGSNNIIIGQVPASSTAQRFFAIGYHSSNNPIMRGIMYDGTGADSYLNVCADKIYLNSGADSLGLYLYNGKLGMIHESPDVEVGGGTFNIQGSGKAITIKGKYVSHGLTSVMDTDTVIALYFKDDNYGAPEIWGAGASTVAGESSPGFKIKGFSKYCDTIDAGNSKRSCVEINCAKINGSDVSSWDATNLIFSVRNNGSSVFFVGGDGKLYSDGSSSVILFDEHEDIKLVQSFSNPENNPYYEKLKEIGVITKNNLFCHNNAMMLTIGAIGQLFNVIRGIAEKLDIPEEELYQLATTYKK